MPRIATSKAGNLTFLSTIEEINVPRFVVLTPRMPRQARTRTIHDFVRACPTTTVAVRSSSPNEDSHNASFAGMFATKLRVPAVVADIDTAIGEVALSGSEKKEVLSHYAAQRGVELSDVGISIIVQEMIEADMSGVIFSHDLARQDGYYMVSVSNGIGDTIVSGAANGRLIRVARGLPSESIQNEWLRTLVVAMKVIEHRYQSNSLDVEFAFRNGTLYILQCRPITTVQQALESRTDEERVVNRIRSLNISLGVDFDGDVLGDMIDINPRELLGAAPTLLDISIFKHLFADNIVERVRKEMGYDPINMGLLRVVAGKPYVSLRASAFSFRPSGIPEEVYERIVAVYRDMVSAHPALQSRVEFDVYAMSCGEKLDHIMEKTTLNAAERSLVQDAFGRLDTAFIGVSRACAATFESYISEYDRQTALLSGSSLGDILAHVTSGTEMFVRVARLAFYWKNKFEETYPQEDLNELIVGHVQSISGQLQADLVACRNGTLSRDELVLRYGHLRPGQFSMFGESYADDPDSYLFTRMGQAEAPKPKKRNHAFQETLEFRNAVMFMGAREQMKFSFSHALHIFVTTLRHALAQRGVLERDASSVSWGELDTFLRGSANVLPVQKQAEATVLLPDVIIPGVTDIGVITFDEAMPSYITQAIIKTRICVLEGQGTAVNVEGALVLLPNADPGYDFLFHSGAAGIITKVGGPASHMCVRAVELQVPSCIGCGEQMYQKLLSARIAILDCASKQIVIPDDS